MYGMRNQYDELYDEPDDFTEALLQHIEDQQHEEHVRWLDNDLYEHSAE